LFVVLKLSKQKGKFAIKINEEENGMQCEKVLNLTENNSVRMFAAEKGNVIIELNEKGMQKSWLTYSCAVKHPGTVDESWKVSCNSGYYHYGNRDDCSEVDGRAFTSEEEALEVVISGIVRTAESFAPGKGSEFGSFLEKSWGVKVMVA